MSIVSVSVSVNAGSIISVSVIVSVTEISLLVNAYDVKTGIGVTTGETVTHA